MRARRWTTAVALTLALAAPPVVEAQAPKPPNPCLDPARAARLWCPDLIMKKPYALALDYFTRRGRVLLRAANSIDNIGLGPAELHGVRSGKYRMRARQRIYKRAGGRITLATRAVLFFKFVPGQRRYWKFNDAARFALFRLDDEGARVRRARIGPKHNYCLRDLKRTRPKRRRSPKRFVYPGCNTSAKTRRVTLGTSVGWSDIYPTTYPEQWIDVTGLRGCFEYSQRVDPGDHIYESNEENNTASVVVRLPYRSGRQRCPGDQAAGQAPLPAPGSDSPY